MVTVLVGLPLRLAGWKLPETVTPVAWALLVGGAWMLLAEHYAEKRGDVATVTWKVAVAVGLAQVVAGVFPGTSRSAAAILWRCWPGPAGAPRPPNSCYGRYSDHVRRQRLRLMELVKDGGLGGENWASVTVAFAAAAITGFLVVRWLMGYIKAHRFTGFAIYRIVLGLLLLALMPTGA